MSFVRAKDRVPKRSNDLGSQDKCTRCSGSHSRERCPASNVVCFRCNKRGHFNSQCQTRMPITHPDGGVNISTAFLDALGKEGPNEWHVTIQLCRCNVTFEIETGAEVSAISEQVLRKIPGCRLLASSKILQGPACEALDVVGQFKGVLSHKGCLVEQNIFVIRGLKNCLFGLPAIRALKLLAKVDEVSSGYQQMIMESYPSLFRGLGNLGDPYEIRLRPDSKPFALCVPRRIAIPLRERVRAELKIMEETGIISSVDEPTPWCSGMVVVPKANG